MRIGFRVCRFFVWTMLSVRFLHTLDVSYFYFYLYLYLNLNKNPILTSFGDSVIDNQTMLALHRAYASVAEYAPDPHQNTMLPPARTIFANLKYGDLSNNNAGYDINLSRLAFPYMTYLYADDWTDLDRTGRPVVFETVLIADRRSAEVGLGVGEGEGGFDFGGVRVLLREEDEEGDSENLKTVKANGNKAKERALVRTTIEETDRRLWFAPAFALPARADWAAPLVESVSELFGSSSNSKTKTKTGVRGVTYVSTQSLPGGRGGGARLKDADHEALVKALKELSGSGNDVHVHVVELGKTGWAEAARAGVESRVMLGVYGGAVANGVLMARTGANAGRGSVKRTVVEFFPEGRYTNECAFVTRALGVEYVAWRGAK